MRKPDFFIVGAAKAGTTSLYNYLNSHPSIYFSPVKEPNYFATDIAVENFCATYRKNTFLDVEGYFEHDFPEPLQLTYIRKEEHYHKLFSKAKPGMVCGEASTSYLVSEQAAQNIFQYNPKAKIIAVLRNPVDRAYSHYLMALRYGHTRLSFRDAIEKDISKKNKGIGISEMFIEFGMYAQQLQRYYDAFPSNQIKIILFDDLVGNTKEILKEVYLFLNIDDVHINCDERHNVAKVPKFPLLNKVITESGVKQLIKEKLNVKAVEALKKMVFSSGDKSALSGEDKKFLQDIYSNEIKELSTILTKNLHFWH